MPPKKKDEAPKERPLLGRFKSNLKVCDQIAVDGSNLIGTHSQPSFSSRLALSACPMLARVLSSIH